MGPVRHLTSKAVLFFWVLFVSFPLLAMVILPASLAQLTDRADLVFQGVCESKKEDVVYNPQSKKEIPVMVYTFRVKDVLKGNVGSFIEVKQWNFSSRSEALGYGLAPIDQNRFDVGQEYLLFMGSPSPQYDGFRWVVGSDQGKFNVIRDSKGVSKVVNPYGNRGLFKGVSVKSASKSEQNVLQSPPGPVPYDDFTSLVKKMVKE